ncbi:M16 family metallopeptidase, partial [Bacteroidota bacterium]
GDYEWSRKNVYNMNSLADYLDIKLREVIREDKSGTYGVSVWADASHYPKENYSFSITFGCNPDRVEELTGEVFSQIDSLISYVPDVSYVNKIKEQQLRAREISVKENNFWLYAINNALFHKYDLTSILNYKERIEKLTPEVINQTAKKYFDLNNYVEIILYPENY